MHRKIKQLREAKGMTQVDLAKDIGVSAAAVNQWEAGTKKPELTKLVLLADLFHVSVDYLLGREAG